MFMNHISFTKWRVSIILLACFAILLFSSGCVQEQPPQQNMTTGRTYEQCFKTGIANQDQLNKSEYEDALWTLNFHRTICVADIAMERNEPQGCDRLSNESLVYDCYSHIAHKTKNVSVCTVMSNQTSSDKCILDFIKLQSQNSSMCSEIKTKSIRDECKDLFE
jgi:hypothetical protein